MSDKTNWGLTIQKQFCFSMEQTYNREGGKEQKMGKRERDRDRDRERYLEHLV